MRKRVAELNGRCVTRDMPIVHLLGSLASSTCDMEVSSEGVFCKEQFRYDMDKDIYLCPADQVLSPRHFGKHRDNVKIDYVNRDACKACSLRERCIKSFRRVSRLENEGGA